MWWCCQIKAALALEPFTRFSNWLTSFHQQELQSRLIQRPSLTEMPNSLESMVVCDCSWMEVGYKGGVLETGEDGLRGGDIIISLRTYLLRSFVRTNCLPLIFSSEKNSRLINRLQLHLSLSMKSCNPASLPSPCSRVSYTNLAPESL